MEMCEVRWLLQYGCAYAKNRSHFIGTKYMWRISSILFITVNELIQLKSSAVISVNSLILDTHRLSQNITYFSTDWRQRVHRVVACDLFQPTIPERSSTQQWVTTCLRVFINNHWKCRILRNKATVSWFRAWRIFHEAFFCSRSVGKIKIKKN